MARLAVARMQVDEKRRTTLPGDILDAAGIHTGTTLVARVEGPGRIILESPHLLLAALQTDIAAGRARLAEAAGDPTVAETSLAEELLAERAADTSLQAPGDELHPPRVS